MVLQMIRAGEESGNLDTMMRRVSAIYEEEVDLVLSSMATTLEPIILMGMGVVIGFITLASFMPMVKLISEI
jgi:type IV pilus assembly protein PilC